MRVWEVLSRRKPGDEWELVGSVNAPDQEMAMHLARETHFRHGEAREYAIRARGEEAVHPCEDPTGIGGVIDREYRRSDGYAGVGAKLKRVHRETAERGLVIDRPRPTAHRGRDEEAARA